MNKKGTLNRYFIFYIRAFSFHPFVGYIALILFIHLAFAIRNPAYSQHNTIPLPTEKASERLVENSFDKSVFHFSMDRIQTIDVDTREGLFSKLMIPGGYISGDLGMPGLPVINRLIEIPFGAEVIIEVQGYSTTELTLSDYDVLHPVMPVQPSLLKSEEPSLRPFYYDHSYYNKAGLHKQELVTVEELGVMRGARIARLTVAPIAYNATEHIIEVYNDISIILRYADVDFALSEYIKESTYSPYFDVVYNRLKNPFKTENSSKFMPGLNQAPVKMLVVSHPDFRQTLRPFIEWKTQKGFLVHEAYTDEIGSTPDKIRQYIRSQYLQGTPENPAPTFLLLVGDTQKLPASGIGSSTQEVTDLYYASIDGDFFPEMFYGRLSARNNFELKNQIDKILYYQKYEFEDPSYLDRATLIAGEDSYWNPQILQPTVKYATVNYYNTLNGFTAVNSYLNNYFGVYSENAMAVGMISYTGHCYPTRWYRPTLSVTDVHQLTNTGRYPLVIGNCCQSGLFRHSESIAEAWMRAGGKGAVAYIGSAPDTHWFEDFYWSVGAFPIVANNGGYVPSPQETTLGAYDAPFNYDYVPVGAIPFVGNMAVTEANASGYQTQSNFIWYWQGYHTFGDPSTMIYKTQGKVNQVSHFPVVPSDHNYFRIEATSGSYVGFSLHSNLLAAGFIGDNGYIDLPTEGIEINDTVKIVITKPQHIPYIVNIPVVALNNAYVVLEGFTINDETENNNQQVDYGETFFLDIAIRNIGKSPTGSLHAIVTGSDKYVKLLHPNVMIGFPALGPSGEDDLKTINKVFGMTVDEQAPDQHKASFRLNITDGVDTWKSDIRIRVNSPRFVIAPEFIFNDKNTGNGNGRLDQGETAAVSFVVTNIGSSASLFPQAFLESDSAQLEVLHASVVGQMLEPHQTQKFTFPIRAKQDAPGGVNYPLRFTVNDGHLASLNTHLTIGVKPEVSIGNDITPSAQYPFYNIYKANRSQMLYLADEIGPGEKNITSLGFNILQYATQYNAFPNFRIRLKHTSLEELEGGFADMSGATEVYFSSLYQMPERTGWHIWPINDFAYDGSSNLIVEVAWGSLPGWTTTFYKVASTPYPENRVAFGYSDVTSNPGFNGVSFLRPNLYMSFTAEPAPIPQPVTFVVTDDAGTPLKNIIVQVQDMNLGTNEEGVAVFHLLPGTYQYVVKENGLPPFEENSFSVNDHPITIEVVKIRRFEAIFVIEDTHAQTIEDAIITIGTTKYDQGIYQIGDLQAGQYDFVVSRTAFFDYYGSFAIDNSNVNVYVTLHPDNTSATQETVYYNPPEYRVYPIPAREQVFVDMAGHRHGKSRVSLLNHQGQLVLHIDADSTPGQPETLVIPLRELPPGLYYIKIEHGGQTVIEKLMVQ